MDSSKNLYANSHGVYILINGEHFECFRNFAYKHGQEILSRERQLYNWPGPVLLDSDVKDVRSVNTCFNQACCFASVCRGRWARQRKTLHAFYYDGCGIAVGFNFAAGPLRPLVNIKNASDAGLIALDVSPFILCMVFYLQIVYFHLRGWLTERFSKFLEITSAYRRLHCGRVTRQTKQ